MAKHGILEPKFKRFMVDNTQANCNVVKVIYGSSDATIPMKEQEKIWFFHWTQSLEKHTKVNIHVELQDQHCQFCRQYKNATSPSKFET
jgi:hypothetical protein